MLGLEKVLKSLEICIQNCVRTLDVVVFQSVHILIDSCTGCLFSTLPKFSANNTHILFIESEKSRAIGCHIARYQ